MTKENVKQFWENRARVTDIPRMESKVNFQSDAEMADLYLRKETELINKELHLKNIDVVVDLGAGNGRFALMFASKVSKVIAVEYIENFADAIKGQAKERGLENVEVINAPAETFCRDNAADVVFVSGLLHYLDSGQYRQIMNNISRTVKQGGILFMREPVSILKNEYIVDKFSKELGANYYSIYRTSKQHIDALGERQFCLEKFAQFFEDGSVLNKRIETKLYYFIFKRIM